EAVLSQWFRADEVADEAGHHNGRDAAPDVVVERDVPEPPAPTPTEIGGLPTRVPGRAGAAAGFGTSSRRSEADSDGNGRAASTSTNGLAAAANGNGNGTNGD